MALEAKVSEAGIYRRLWEPPVPSQLVQFLVGTAAAQYTAENALEYLRQKESDVELAIEQALARAASREGGAEIVMRQAVVQHVETYRAREERLKSLCNRLIAYAPAAQGAFGVKAEGTVKEYSLEIALEMPTGQKQIFAAPRGAPVPPPKNRFLPGLSVDTESLYAHLSVYANGIKRGETVAMQHLASRLGAEAPQLSRI